jgi:hypothetical protein
VAMATMRIWRGRWSGCGSSGHKFGWWGDEINRLTYSVSQFKISLFLCFRCLLCKTKR